MPKLDQPQTDDFSFADAYQKPQPNHASATKDYGVLYVLKGKEWYARNKQNEWVPLAGIEAVRRYLIAAGIDPAKKKDETWSDVDAAIHQIEMNRFVDFIGRYSGYLSAGKILLPSGDTLLVPRARVLPSISAGECEFILDFIEGIFVSKTQRDAFLGWLQTSVRTLREDTPGDWSPGQALILLGDTGTGKTSLQRVVTEFLSGREANPSKYFVGDSQFNGELAEAEHWAISDPAWADSKQKQKFAKSFKNSVADSMTAVEAKYQQSVNIPLYKRLTLSINEDEESLSVLPLMDKSYLEKLMILECVKSDFTPKAKTWKWLKTVREQAPAFLHWLLNDFQIPTALFDERYGVAFRNSRVEPKITAPTPEDKDHIVDEIIVKALLTLTDNNGSVRTRTSSTTEVHHALFGKDSDYREVAKASSLPNHPTYLGRTLTEWANTNNGQRNGFRVERIDGRTTKYKFTQTF